jgi:hypothetical protein
MRRKKHINYEITVGTEPKEENLRFKALTGHQYIYERANDVEEIIRVNSVFFDKSPEKQRKLLLLFIWWAIKSYFKTIFKDKPQFTKWRN